MAWFKRSGDPSGSHSSGSRAPDSTGNQQDSRSSNDAAALAQASSLAKFGLSQQVLNVLPSIAIVVDASSHVVIGSSTSAHETGLVTGDRIEVAQLLDLTHEARGSDVPVDQEVVIRRTQLQGGDLVLQVRAATIGPDTILILAQDLTTQRNIEAMRRDFVVNVSHELKTPVGALGLLAEAILADVDDADQVRHFAERIDLESSRLSHLIADIVELSRLQGDDAQAEFEQVALREVILQAVDAVMSAADAKSINIVCADDIDVVVEGVKSQLVAALRNLLANAVSYSPDNTRVAIGVMQENGTAAIVVADQGQGIPAQDLDRIFERFYRVDQARSRSTGGTGLGLSIVKHICINHGGDVTVRSIEGEGSTFTMRIRRVQEAQHALDNQTSDPGTSDQREEG